MRNFNARPAKFEVRILAQNQKQNFFNFKCSRRGYLYGEFTAVCGCIYLYISCDKGSYAYKTFLTRFVSLV